MEKVSTEQYRCSKCGRIEEFQCYHEIDINETPQLHEAVLKGKIFEAVCPDCKAVNFIPYPMLYRDEERKLMLFLTQSTSRQNPLNELFSFLKEQQDEESRRLLRTMQQDYKIRLVRTPNALSEKILIFENGRDDRVLEMMKVLMRGEIARAYPDLKINGLYYSPAAGRMNDVFSIESDKGFGQAVDVYSDLYEGIEKEVMPKLSKEMKEAACIDEDWAFEAMGYREKTASERKMN